MKDRDASRHPGPWRVMKVDSEFAGLLVAVGFLVMGFVSMPIATWFILGAVALGVFVALVLRFIPKKYSRVVVGTVVILATAVHSGEVYDPVIAQSGQLSISQKEAISEVGGNRALSPLSKSSRFSHLRHIQQQLKAPEFLSIAIICLKSRRTIRSISMGDFQMQSNSEGGMVGTKPQLILFGSDSAQLEKLKPYSAELPYISYEVGYGPQVAAKAHLDAFWVTLMGAIELFGAAPPFPLHQARVLPTPAAQINKGFPRYGVVGVAVSQNDPKTPEYNLRLVMSALLKAVNDFNSENQEQILRIGILPDDLELKELKPEVAFKIVHEVYESA